MNGHIARLVVLLSAISILSSCAAITSTTKKFTPQTAANMGIFADQTISMLSDADFGFTRKQTLYTREFFDFNEKEEMEIRKLRHEADALFIRIIKYSLDLVLIAETKKTAADRVAAYSERVANMNNQVVEKIGVEPDRYDDIQKEVAKAEDFLDALRAAQPIINAAGRYMHQILDRTDKAIDVVVNKIDEKIEEEFAEVILYQEKLEDEKYSILRSLAYLYGSYKGNMEAYAALSKGESIYRKDLIPEPPPNDDDLKAIAEYLQTRLKALHLIETEIKHDWDSYRAAHSELDALHDKAKRDNSKARLIVLVWLRAHQKMASGVSSPAEWFDISTLPSTLFSMGAKAVF
jgi:hypothetical protein